MRGGTNNNDMEPDDYVFRQSHHDEAYMRAYSEWVESLTEDERRELGKLGVEEAYLPKAGSGAPTRDAAESSFASCGPAEVCEDEVEDSLPSDFSYDAERMHDMIRRLIGELIGTDNARLSLECLAIVTGLSYCGDSMTEIAKRHGVTRAAVSKRCVELTRALNLKPSRAMRSLSSRKNYRRARLRHLTTQI